MSLTKHPMLVRIVCVVLATTFVTGQVYAANGPTSCVALPPVSDDIAQGTPHDRSKTVKDDVAGDTLPGAIGNGAPLIALLKGKEGLPPKILFSEQVAPYYQQKIRSAIKVALLLSTENFSKIEDTGFTALTRQTLSNLIDFNAHLSEQLYPMFADRTGTEDYLIGSALDLFEMEEKAAIAIDFIDFLYTKYADHPEIAEKRLAQYLFHERTPERTVLKDDGTLDLSEHKAIYTKLQTVIFGADEVAALKHDLREFIDSGVVASSWQSEMSVAPKPENSNVPAFRVGEVNSAETIRALAQIDGLSIAEIERRARPGSFSMAGFLAPRESLIDVLLRDNRFVRSRGFTHQKLAAPLLAAMGSDTRLTPSHFIYNGRTYTVVETRYRGWQDSIFNDGLIAGSDYVVTDTETGKKISFSALLPEYIRRYGFYEGSTPYRLDPADIIAMFFPNSKPQPVQMDYRTVMTQSDIDARINEMPKSERPGIGFLDPPGDGELTILFDEIGGRLSGTDLTAFGAFEGDLYVAYLKSEVGNAPVVVRMTAQGETTELAFANVPQKIRREFKIPESVVAVPDPRKTPDALDEIFDAIRYELLIPLRIAGHEIEKGTDTSSPEAIRNYLRTKDSLLPFNGRPHNDPMLEDLLVYAAQLGHERLMSVTREELVSDFEKILDPNLCKAILFYILNNNFIGIDETFTAKDIADKLGVSAELVTLLLLPYNDNATGLSYLGYVEVMGDRPSASVVIGSRDTALRGEIRFAKREGIFFYGWEGGSHPTLNDLIRHVRTMHEQKTYMSEKPLPASMDRDESIAPAPDAKQIETVLEALTTAVRNKQYGITQDLVEQLVSLADAQKDAPAIMAALEAVAKIQDDVSARNLAEKLISLAGKEHISFIHDAFRITIENRIWDSTEFLTGELIGLANEQKDAPIVATAIAIAVENKDWNMAWVSIPMLATRLASLEGAAAMPVLQEAHKTASQLEELHAAEAIARDIENIQQGRSTTPVGVAAPEESREFQVRSEWVKRWHENNGGAPGIIIKGKTVGVMGEVFGWGIVVTGASENLIAFLMAVATLKEHVDFSKGPTAYEPFFSTIRYCDEYRGKVEKGRIDRSQLDIAWFDRFYTWVDDDGKVFLTYSNNGPDPEMERITTVFKEAVGAIEPKKEMAAPDESASEITEERIGQFPNVIEAWNAIVDLYHDGKVAWVVHVPRDVYDNVPVERQYSVAPGDVIGLRLANEIGHGGGAPLPVVKDRPQGTLMLFDTKGPVELFVDHGNDGAIAKVVPIAAATEDPGSRKPILIVPPFNTKPMDKETYQAMHEARHGALKEFLSQTSSGAAPKDGSVAPSSVVEVPELLTAAVSLPHIDMLIQLEALKAILQDQDIAREMAEWQDGAYYRGQGLQPPAFAQPEDAPEAIQRKVAQNLAGFYALECGLGVICERMRTTPLAVLQKITAGELPREDRILIARFANATWKAGQPFIGLPRISRATFRPAALLTDEELEKDFVQIEAAAKKMQEHLQRVVSGEGMTGDERRLLDERADRLVALIASKTALSAADEERIRDTVSVVMFAHASQKRKGGVVPYFNHQLDVAERFIQMQGAAVTPFFIQVCLFHDTREDQEDFYADWRSFVRNEMQKFARTEMAGELSADSVKDLQVNFPPLLLGVRLLSKLTGKKYEGIKDPVAEYYARLLDPKSAYNRTDIPRADEWYGDLFIRQIQLIKLADRLANIEDLGTGFATDSGVELTDTLKAFPRKMITETADRFAPLLVEGSSHLTAQDRLDFYTAFRRALERYDAIEHAGDAAAAERAVPLIAAARERLEKARQLEENARASVEASQPGGSSVNGPVRMDYTRVMTRSAIAARINEIPESERPGMRFITNPPDDGELIISHPEVRLFDRIGWDKGTALTAFSAFEGAIYVAYVERGRLCAPPVVVRITTAPAVVTKLALAEVPEKIRKEFNIPEGVVPARYAQLKRGERAWIDNIAERYTDPEELKEFFARVRFGDLDVADVAAQGLPTDLVRELRAPLMMAAPEEPADQPAHDAILRKFPQLDLAAQTFKTAALSILSDPEVQTMDPEVTVGLGVFRGGVNIIVHNPAFGREQNPATGRHEEIGFYMGSSKGGLTINTTMPDTDFTKPREVPVLAYSEIEPFLEAVKESLALQKQTPLWHKWVETASTKRSAAVQAPAAPEGPATQSADGPPEPSRGSVEAAAKQLTDTMKNIVQKEISQAVESATLTKGELAAAHSIRKEALTQVLAGHAPDAETLAVFEAALPSDADVRIRAMAFRKHLMDALQKESKKLFFIGIENDIGGTFYKDDVTVLAKAIAEIEEMKAPDGKKLFPKLVVRRGSAATLVSTVQGLVDGEGLELRRVFIAARHESVKIAKAYTSVSGSWIADIDDGNAGTYLPVPEALMLGIMAYLGCDIEAIEQLYSEIAVPVSREELEKMRDGRIFYILPKTVKFDTDSERRDAYERFADIYRMA